MQKSCCASEFSAAKLIIIFEKSHRTHPTVKFHHWDAVLLVEEAGFDSFTGLFVDKNVAEI
jgi:hypothetical protein